MRGRITECVLLDGVVGAIRASESRTLVLHGEAGIGKTALLKYIVESAADMRFLRAAGVESEMELAFASLHQLCLRYGYRGGVLVARPRKDEHMTSGNVLSNQPKEVAVTAFLTAAAAWGGDADG